MNDTRVFVDTFVVELANQPKFLIESFAKQNFQSKIWALIQRFAL
jgi:hypothetical protein